MEIESKPSCRDVPVSTTITPKSTNSQLGRRPFTQERDGILMARFGKKQQLKRRFSLLPAVGITSALMITWQAVANILLNGLENGGPAGLVYGYLISWFGATFQTLVMAELAIPLAGGPFNWVAIMAPSWCSKYLSYLVGWLTFISYTCLVASTSWCVGTMIQGLLVLNYPDYVFQKWHGTLLFYAVVAIALFVNTYLGRVLPQIESLILFFHILGFFAVLICILHLVPERRSAEEVFTTFLNEGQWNSRPLAFFVGLLSSTNAFCGLDAADHIAEEIHGASRVIPIAMCTSVILNGVMGLGMMLALQFCMPADITSVIDTETKYPFIAIFHYAVGSVEGATALTAVLICASICAAVGILATASRMVWAFAREGGLPFSRYLSRVNPSTGLPIWAISVTTLLNLLLALTNIGSEAGFLAFTSLTVASYNSSFVLAACVMLHKRWTTSSTEIPYGWFRLHRAQVPVTIVAIIYCIIVAFFSMWPTKVHPTMKEMNWCVLLWGATLTFSVLFWFAHGKARYTGPKIEI